MRSVREAIIKDEYPAFIRTFMRKMYADGKYPQWAVDALASVGVDLTEKLGDKAENGQ